MNLLSHILKKLIFQNSDTKKIFLNFRDKKIHISNSKTKTVVKPI